MATKGENIYLRKDGRYEGRIKNGYREDGKVKYRSVYGCSLDEVRGKMAKIHGQPQNKSGMTVKSLFCEWLEAICARVKESTVANYRMKAEKHLLPAFGQLDCCEVTPHMVQEFISEKLKSGLSARYVSDIVVLLKSLFKYAERTYQIIDRITYVVMPKKQRPEIHILDNSQQKILEKYLIHAKDNTSFGIMLTLYTGLRIGELCALKWEDIDLKKRTLTVRHTLQRISSPREHDKTQLVITEPKSFSSQRTIPLPDCIIAMLKKFRNKPHTFILSGTEKPIEPRTMQYRFSAILKNVNLPSVHFHSLRHLFASNCIALGFDVKALSEMLGHSSVQFTLDRYVHSSLEQKRKYMQLFSFAV